MITLYYKYTEIYYTFQNDIILLYRTTLCYTVLNMAFWIETFHPNQCLNMFWKDKTSLRLLLGSICCPLVSCPCDIPPVSLVRIFHESGLAPIALHINVHANETIERACRRSEHVATSILYELPVMKCMSSAFQTLCEDTNSRIFMLAWLLVHPLGNQITII